MTVKEFVDEYNNSNDRKKFCDKHIVNKYISYATKISDCERIANSSCYTQDGRFKPDGIVTYILYIRTLLEKYTDLVFEESTLEELDELEKVGAVNQIIESIPGSEKSIYKTILDIKLDDISSYESDVVTFLRSGFDFLNEVFGNQENQNGDVVETAKEDDLTNTNI